MAKGAYDTSLKSPCSDFCRFAALYQRRGGGGASAGALRAAFPRKMQRAAMLGGMPCGWSGGGQFWKLLQGSCYLGRETLETGPVAQVSGWCLGPQRALPGKYVVDRRRVVVRILPTNWSTALSSPPPPLSSTPPVPRRSFVEQPPNPKFTAFGLAAHDTSAGGVTSAGGTGRGLDAAGSTLFCEGDDEHPTLPYQTALFDPPTPGRHT